MAKNIRARVGAGAANHTGDVRTVQYLLNCVPARRGGPVSELAVDGVAGESTLQAVARFVRRVQAGSEVFTPRGPALRALQQWDPYPRMKMPDPVPRPPEWAAVRPRTLAASAEQAVTGAVAYVRAHRGCVRAGEVALGMLPWERELERAAASVARVAGTTADQQLEAMLRQALEAAAPGDAVEAEFGYPRGAVGRSVLVARLAEAARNGARCTEWPGVPGGGQDGLWRAVQLWLESRPWR
ncbi:MAG: hypothetical protein IT163_19130 [Bryobacterales bacterium]|nr:hypothetical protein [Bryobacterales bacterium]